ncbi:ferrous iron transport protein A [Candidatus Latescibacterota bacterium]
MISILTVDDLPPGGCGIIKKINADTIIKQRLMDMGIIEGVKVEMIRPAPLGDPIQIKVLNTLIALRRNEARSLVIDSAGDIYHGRKAHRHRFGRKSKQRKIKPF